MELSIVHREKTCAPPNQCNKSETITNCKPWTAPLCAVNTLLDRLSSTKVSIKSSGETIPIHLFLGGFDLTPTFREVNKKSSTRYHLNLVLSDEEIRRYFKQQISPAHQVIFIKTSAEKTLAIQVNLHSSSDSRICQKRIGQKRR
ncbi:hypothetical protein H2248_011315 [Termitomyces sp. 'cryptogamus']|nr:hypothetical protein H2248_011315 [Termitomyces sp. 'cryptogamus']